jgi:hypothetical protein
MKKHAVLGRALRVLLVIGSVPAWSLAQAADLLTSLDRIDGGRILSCDYELVSAKYLFTCEDVYGEFSLQCFVDNDEPPLPPPVRGMVRSGFICPVSREHSIQGNALRLGCVKNDAKDVEKHIEQFGIPPGLLTARLRMAQCASAKVDTNWSDFHKAEPLDRPKIP